MKNEIKEIKIDDKEYPYKLLEINNPPKRLFCIGDTSLLKEEMIAIVGTRRCSPYGRWVGEELGKRIAEAGIGIVSGMAEGIDTAGHKGCLKANGKTIAVLGTGIDVCFPKSNEKLYEEIKEKGLVVSEYEPGLKGLAYNFPLRNRIISGLSRSVIVVEGAMKSGSLITAGLAAEQGRDVFAVPGNINQPNSVGVNRLIADGAFPIIDLDMLSETLHITSRAYTRYRENLSAEEDKIYKMIFESPGVGSEYIALNTDMSASEINYILTSLELKNLIRRDGNCLYIVC